MFVTSSEQRSGLLIAVISGGRPTLEERFTRKYLAALEDFGANDVVWVVNEKDVPDYEIDPDHPMCVYPREWAYEYAKKHWMLASPPNPGFLGAFPGREWACQEAERRGCWGVMMLDDNIIRLGLPRDTWAGREVVDRNGGLALFADLIAATTLSTNGRMVGAQLSAIPNVKVAVARSGFTYSLFIEQVGAGREDWYGPYEDDITHAYQYGTRADAGSSTAAVLDLLRYKKESGSKSAMRSYYDHTRAVSLQRIFPESAKVIVKKHHANGRGEARVYHHMNPNAIRNKLLVKDRELFESVRARLAELLKLGRELSELRVREKVTWRANS